MLLCLLGGAEMMTWLLKLIKTNCATTHSNDIKVFYKQKEKQKTRKGIVQILFGRSMRGK